ncbi:MAG: hypothetical protein ACFFDI_05860 [Promethearchaeota archaeon]
MAPATRQLAVCSVAYHSYKPTALVVGNWLVVTRLSTVWRGFWREESLNPFSDDTTSIWISFSLSQLVHVFPDSIYPNYWFYDKFERLFPNESHIPIA